MIAARPTLVVEADRVMTMPNVQQPALSGRSAGLRANETANGGRSAAPVRGRNFFGRHRRHPRAAFGVVHLRLPGLWMVSAIAIFSALPATKNARATTIDASESIGPVPAAAGSGLLASYTKLGTSQTATLSAAGLAAQARQSPSVTYLARTICFPTCAATEKGGNTLASYAAANGTNLVGETRCSGHHTAAALAIWAIFVPGVYPYTVTSDDGSELMISGKTIIDMENQPTWSPFGWEVHAAAMAEPVHVWPERFAGMANADGAGQSRMPEFIAIPSTFPGKWKTIDGCRTSLSSARTV
jgi:hypothetical protein